MKPFLTWAIMLLLVNGCRQPSGPCRNLDKWLLNAGDNRRPLNGRPKIITEYTYKASDTGRPERQRMCCDKYCFSADGDLIWRKTYYNDTLVTTYDGSYDANGHQWKDSDLTTGKSTIVVSRRLVDGGYKAIEKVPDSTTSSIYHYSVDGREMIREIYHDTTTRHKTYGYHYFYDGARLTKIKVSTGEANVERRFYYSRWDMPDSTDWRVSMVLPWILEREYNKINNHGDPIRHIRIKGKDTLEFEAYRYEYDHQGNWTRRMTVVYIDKYPDKGDWFPGESRVMEREFVYQ